MASKAGVECFSFSQFHGLPAGTFLDVPLPGFPVPAPSVCPHNPPIACLDCPSVTQKPPVTLNFFE